MRVLGCVKFSAREERAKVDHLNSRPKLGEAGFYDQIARFYGAELLSVLADSC